MALRDESASVLSILLGEPLGRRDFFSQRSEKFCNLVKFSAKEVPGNEAGNSTQGGRLFCI